MTAILPRVSMNEAILSAAVKALDDLWDEGCPIPSPSGRDLLARTGLRRWHSLARRHRRPERLSRAERIRDLAKDLVEVSEPDPRAVGSLMNDYECAAEAIVQAIEVADPARVAAAAADRRPPGDGVWGQDDDAQVEGRLELAADAIGRLPDIVVEHADLGRYGSGRASFGELFVTARDGSLRLSHQDGGLETHGMLVLLCRLAPFACLMPGAFRSRSADGSGAHSVPSARVAVRNSDSGWDRLQAVRKVY